MSSKEAEEEEQFSSVQFSLLSDWVVGGHDGRFSRNPLPVFSEEGAWRVVMAWAGMSTV